MGLRDWFAGSVAGPQSYGNAMGREAREGGSALANALFLSHGSQLEKGPVVIYETPSEMQSAGFRPRYPSPTAIELSSLTTDELRLLRHLTTAMISYTFIVNSNGALQNMRRENTSKFRNGLGPSLKDSMVSCGLFENSKAAETALMSYIESMGQFSMVLNKSKPASGDLLEHFLIRGVEASQPSRQYGFVRAGFTGFDSIAVTIVEQTLVAIVSATQKFKW